MKTITLEIIDCLKHFKVWLMLGYFDVSKRYKRSTIGQFWITISTAILVLGMTIIYSTIFKLDPKFYFLYLTINFCLWTFIKDTLQESCSAFTSCSSQILNEKWNLLILLMRVISRNLLTFFHNFILIFFAIIYSSAEITLVGIFISLANFFILILILINLSLVIAIFTTRYRDFAMIISNGLQLVFFITPVFWTRDMLLGYEWVVNFNPLALVLNSITSSIIYNKYIMMETFYLFLIFLISGLISFFVYYKKKNQISYWL
jgi:lipopolysaccharide transport system permease protein